MPVDRDQAVAPIRERALVHPRLVVEAVEIGVGTELHQIPPTTDVQSEQDEVESTIGHSRSRSIPSISGPPVSIGRDVRLDPEDGLDAFRSGGRVELESRVQISVVGDRDRGHSEFLHASNEAFDPVPAIKEGILAVKMKVDEVVRGLGFLPGGGRLLAGLGGLRFRAFDLVSHHHSILGR